VKQHGYAWLIYVVVIAGVVVALGLVARAIDKRGYERGALEVRDEWNQANAKARAEQRRRDGAVAAEILGAERRWLAAEQAATESRQQLEEAKRNAQRSGTALATCTRTAQPNAAVRRADREGVDRAAGPANNKGGSGAPADDLVPRLTWAGVRFYDGAWTDAAGKPVFAAPARPEGAAEADPSPYGFGELDAVHAENARRCSEDRREHAKIIEELRGAARAWGAQ
jgi:hypothetical protein